MQTDQAPQKLTWAAPMIFRLDRVEGTDGAAVLQVTEGSHVLTTTNTGTMSPLYSQTAAYAGNAS